MVDYCVFAYEKVSIAEAREVSVKQKERPQYAHLRRPTDPGQIRLSHATALWIMGLPKDVRPLVLARKYPRIANLLAKVWEFPAVFEARVGGYLLDERGTRQGFPVEVLQDLFNLKNFVSSPGFPVAGRD